MRRYQSAPRGPLRRRDCERPWVYTEWSARLGKSGYWTSCAKRAYILRLGPTAPGRERKTSKILPTTEAALPAIATPVIPIGTQSDHWPVTRGWYATTAARRPAGVHAAKQPLRRARAALVAASARQAMAKPCRRRRAGHRACGGILRLGGDMVRRVPAPSESLRAPWKGAAS